MRQYKEQIERLLAYDRAMLKKYLPATDKTSLLNELVVLLEERQRVSTKGVPNGTL